MPSRKNPVPKIGRKFKTGYQEKVFKPSRKLLRSLGLSKEQYERRHQQQLKRAVERVEKQKYRTRYEQTELYKQQLYEDARTFAPEVVFGKPRDWFEQYEDNLKRLGDLVKSGQYTGKFLGIDDLPRGSIIDRIATLSNLIGLPDTADALNTNEDLLDMALQGNRLNRLSEDELTEGYSHLSRDRELQDDFGIDINTVEYSAKVLSESIRLIDFDLANIFRNAVADNDVNLDVLAKNYTLLVGTLNSNQLSKILDAYQQQKETGSYTTYVDGEQTQRKNKIDLNEMFEMYEADGGDIWDIEESEFWAWFRELFY